MSKILLLKFLNLFNENVLLLSNKVYPLIFFENLFRNINYTVPKHFNLFNNKIKNLSLKIKDIINNTAYFLNNKVNLNNIIKLEEIALNTIEYNIENINNLKKSNFYFINYYKYDIGSLSLEDFINVKKFLFNLTDNLFNIIENKLYIILYNFLIQKQFILEDENDSNYYKIPIDPFIIKYNKYFLNLIFNVNYSNIRYLKNEQDFYNYDLSDKISNTNKYTNVTYAIINKSNFNDNQFKRLKNFIIINDNIPI